MHVVIRLQNIFPRVIQIPIPKQKSQAAVVQIILMIFFNCIGHEGDADLIEFAMPA